MDINLSNDKDYVTLLEKNQHKVLGRVERDTVTLRLSAMIAVQIPDGRISGEVAVQRSRLLEREEKELKWLTDYEEVFGEYELSIIAKEIRKLLGNIPEKIVEVSDKATKEEVYGELITYIMKKESELISPDETMLIIPTVLLREDAGYIRTREFEKFVIENKSLGWSRQEILKMLKRNNLLKTGNGRTYDKKVKINGISNNYYVIKILQDKRWIIDDETIEIKLRGNNKND